MARGYSDLAIRRHGGPWNHLGTIVGNASTSTNNATTAVAFGHTAATTLRTKSLLIQPDAACYVILGEDDDVEVSATNGYYLPANTPIDFNMHEGLGYIAILSASGTVNLKVWEIL